jgi:transcriptional regulator with XRE-family HTH domain
MEATKVTVGERLRELRIERGLTLEQVAEAAGLSKSYISQLENDKSNPSLNSLQAIMRVYELPLAVLFEHPETHSVLSVVRASQRKTYALPDSAVRREFLTPDTRRKLEAVLTIAEAGEDSGQTPFSHEGEEFGLVLSGRLKFCVGSESCILEEGDSVYFDCSLPHRWESIGDTPAAAIWVMTPPSF